MKLIKSSFRSISRYISSAGLILLGMMSNAFATSGGGRGIDTSKIPDFKIPGVDSNTTDPMEIIHIVVGSLAMLAAVLFAAWSIFSVVKALIKTYNQATDENDKKGWGPFITALIIGFIVIFFCLWLVKMAIGLF